MHFIEIGLSFFEGLALIASPCILPVLPLIFSTSMDGGRNRPFGIITGFIVAFALFALLSRELVFLFDVNLNYIKNGSLILLALLGIIMLSEKLSEYFSHLTQKISLDVGNVSAVSKNGFLSGLFVGGLIGLVWTPCAGPILAAVLVQVIRQQNDISAILLILAFAIGAGIPMLLISLTGRKLMTKLSFFKVHANIIRKTLGILILVAVIFIASGLRAQNLFSSPNSNTATQPAKQLQNGLQTPYPAPEFATSDIWLNTPGNKPLTMDALKGKVVLVDFWTYSCINCIRTLPYLNNWYKKYHDKGLVIVGVHAPEFEFEKNKANVVQAIAQDGVRYPVAMDNNLDTWTNFNNQYWPAHYLIDKDGEVVYTHFGEGQYEETENNIRVLLGLNRSNINEEPLADFSINQTPETYLGYERTESFGSPEGIEQDTDKIYSLPSFLPTNNWALSGKWLIQAQHIVSEEANTKLAFNFTAKHVYLVLGSTEKKSIKLAIKLNGYAIKTAAGKDVKNGVVTVQEHRLYELVNQEKSANGLLEIDVSQQGLEAYAFTFG
jgi:cytochrome c biogenesis protein CcdA/thiol-disulfide isomerase/thioredoxin